MPHHSNNGLAARGQRPKLAPHSTRDLVLSCHVEGELLIVVSTMTRCTVAPGARLTVCDDVGCWRGCINSCSGVRYATAGQKLNMCLRMTEPPWNFYQIASNHANSRYTIDQSWLLEEMWLSSNPYKRLDCCLVARKPAVIRGGRDDCEEHTFSCCDVASSDVRIS